MRAAMREMNQVHRPKLLFLRFTRPNLPQFVNLHLTEQVACLRHFFCVTVVNDCTDLDEICDRTEPDLIIFESGVYVGPRSLKRSNTHPSIPRLGFIHCDAYCPTRKTALADMSEWGIENFFTTSVALPSYTPPISGRLFVWPNFVDPLVYRDYELPKTVPVLFTGSQAAHYPWRNRVSKVLAQRFPCMTTPHFGWFEDATRTKGQMLHGERYAKMINSASVAPACGGIAHEVVRKHFEIPACNTCLVTEKSQALVAAGFQDGVNCIFADCGDVVDKLLSVFETPEDLQRISTAGKMLVQQRHTAANRNEVLQWFQLQRDAGPRQRPVQLAPFMPLSIVDESFVFPPLRANTIDRCLLEEGDTALRMGRFVTAETAYRRSLAYVPNMSEAILRMAVTSLHEGDPRTALELLGKELRDTFSIGHVKEPDPVELSYFIIALICVGKHKTAAKLSARFVELRHVELERVRVLLSALGQRLPHGEDLLSHRPRLSIHAFPLKTDTEWLTQVVLFLKACGQTRLAAEVCALRSSVFMMQGGSSRFRRRLCGISPHPARDGESVTALLRAHESPLRKLLRPFTSIARRLRRKFSQMLQSATWYGKRNETVADIERLLRYEAGKRVTLIGKGNNRQPIRQLLPVLSQNPNVHDIRVFTRNLNEVKRFFDPHTAFISQSEGADILVIDYNGISGVSLRAASLNATLVVLIGITTPEGHAMCSALISGTRYVLIRHEIEIHFGGYAAFRSRCEPKQAQMWCDRNGPAYAD